MANNGIKLSIDRLTIVAEDSLLLSPNHLPALYGLKYFGNRTDAYQIEIDTTIDDEIVTENIAFINYYSFGRDKMGIRVDFNPNRRKSVDVDNRAWKTLDKILTSLIGNKRLSRIDIAFDVFDDRMRSYRYFKPGIKRSFYGKDGDIETLYYGSPLSDRQIRQYNKQREQLKRGLRSDAWWRFELQLRTKFIEDATLQVEEALHWFKSTDWSSIENVSDKMMLMALDVEPSVYAELSKQKKAKVNLLRRSSSDDELAKQMLSSFELSKDDLQRELSKYILENGITF